MDNYEFNLLSIKQKARFTWHNGTFLASRVQGAHLVKLYHEGHFFIEVFYNLQNNAIVNIRSATGKSCLDPYLEDIDIK